MHNFSRVFFTKTMFSLQKLNFLLKIFCYHLKTRQKVAIFAKKHSPSRIFLSQCLKIYPRVIWEFSLGILIEKMEPRIFPRSRPTASTSKRTSASIFSIAIPKENSQITLGKIFQTLRSDNPWRKGPFLQISCLFNIHW